MSTTTAISANAQNNNGGTILGAGNFTSGPITNDLSHITNAFLSAYGSRVILADGSPNSSGNLGTMRAISGGAFGQMEDGFYVAKILGTRIAQTDNTFLRSGSSDVGQSQLHYSRGYRRLDYTSWNYATGAVTQGGSEGNAVTFINPVGGAAIAIEPFPTDAIPGELVYREGGSTPTQDDYKARTSP